MGRDGLALPAFFLVLIYATAGVVAAGRLYCGTYFGGAVVIDGFYAITFRGTADWGMGMFILKAGKITGADIGGVIYDGSYVEHEEHVDVSVNARVPPGATLVQGVPAQSVWTTYDFSGALPKRALDTNEPVLLNLPPGPVNVIFKRVRSAD